MAKMEIITVVSGILVAGISAVLVNRMSGSLLISLGVFVLAFLAFPFLFSPNYIPGVDVD